MADGDIVHSGIPARFQQPYVEVCEGVLMPEDIAWDILARLKKELRQYGDGPVVFIGRVEERLRSELGYPLLFDEMAKSNLSMDIEQLSRAVSGHSRGLSFALESCKRYCWSTVAERDPDRVAVNLYRAYGDQVYRALFESPAPLRGRHHNGVSNTFVVTQLATIRPHVDNGIESFAKQMAQHRTVTSLRMPSRRRNGPEKLGLDTLIVTADSLPSVT